MSIQWCISISKEKTVHTVILTFSSPFVCFNLLQCLFFTPDGVTQVNDHVTSYPWGLFCLVWTIVMIYHCLRFIPHSHAYFFLSTITLCCNHYFKTSISSWVSGIQILRQSARYLNFEKKQQQQYLNNILMIITINSVVDSNSDTAFSYLTNVGTNLIPQGIYRQSLVKSPDIKTL